MANKLLSFLSTRTNSLPSLFWGHSYIHDYFFPVGLYFPPTCFHVSVLLFFVKSLFLSFYCLSDPPFFFCFFFAVSLTFSCCIVVFGFDWQPFYRVAAVKVHSSLSAQDQTEFKHGEKPAGQQLSAGFNSLRSRYFTRDLEETRWTPSAAPTWQERRSQSLLRVTLENTYHAQGQGDGKTSPMKKPTKNTNPPPHTQYL